MTQPTSEKIPIIVAMDFAEELIEQLREVSPQLEIKHYWPDVPEAAWADVEILYTMRHFPEPEQVPLLRWIQLHYAGMERVMTKRIAQAEDVVITSASGIHSTQMANFAIMMMMAFNYRLPQMFRFQSNAEWHPDRFTIFSPEDMRQQTVGIVGYGSIGRELARLAQTMGMRVLASKRDAMHPAETEAYTQEGTGDPEGEIPERIYPAEAIATMAAECDYLVLTLPHTEDTHHVINEAIFEAMKPTAVLINVARGGVVDEADLISALAADKIRGAALDVFEEEPLPSTSPLWNLDNVILSPHVSGNSARYHEQVIALFTENLRHYLDKRPLMNALNRDVGY